MRPSGSGKSTLLNLVAGLDTPTSGSILVEGQTVDTLGDDALTDLRRTRVGIIFQFFNLLPSLTALDNVALPLRAGGVSRSEMAARAGTALQRLEDRAEHRPTELSGGEMQRVAIARALAIEPAIILADESTGSLDSLAGGGDSAPAARVQSGASGDGRARDAQSERGGAWGSGRDVARWGRGGGRAQPAYETGAEFATGLKAS